MKADAALDLCGLGFDRGAHLLVRRALRSLSPGATLEVRGTAPNLTIELSAWARSQGHEIIAGGERVDPATFVRRGATDDVRWRTARPAGRASFTADSAVADAPEATWGLAARGAFVEAGTPRFEFRLHEKYAVWTDDAARLYQQAAAAQWDPGSAIPWDAQFRLPDEIEDAVVQTMTYLIENETAALFVPARFLGEVHPHFREVVQLLAIQVADEARHIEVFTRRALHVRESLGLSTAGGQASLKTLLDEPDFALASFLLSVLGEGSFLGLLGFLHEHAPDPITAAVARLAAQDEARHVAFGMGHLTRHLGLDPSLRGRLETAVRSRHDALAQTAGLNEEVFDALVLIAAGRFEPDAIARGFASVVALVEEMDEGRQRRLRKLGWSAAAAAELSSLHTRNFM
jgi:TusA-related sulfurtransferase